MYSTSILPVIDYKSAGKSIPNMAEIRGSVELFPLPQSFMNIPPF